MAVVDNAGCKKHNFVFFVFFENTLRISVTDMLFDGHINPGCVTDWQRGGNVHLPSQPFHSEAGSGLILPLAAAVWKTSDFVVFS